MIDFVLSAFVGTAIGLRFPVLALVPALVVGATMTAVIAAVSGDGSAAVALAVGLSLLGLQMGYFLGALGASCARATGAAPALQKVKVKSAPSGRPSSIQTPL